MFTLLKEMLKSFSIAIALLSGCTCFTMWQTDCIRQHLVRKNIPYGFVHDTVLVGIAWTDFINKHTYVDGVRLLNSPMTFSNVIDHETDHLLGRMHEDCINQYDIMCYSVKVNSSGVIIDDRWLYAWL